MVAKNPLLDIVSYPAKKRLQYALDIAEGMAFLHSKRFIHRDLKSANILCTKSGRCKITDFGLSKLLEDPLALKDKQATPGENPSKFGINTPSDTNSNPNGPASLDMTGYVGSVVWMAPEVMKSNNVVYDQAVDVFSYAMVLFEIITGDIPWQKAKDADEVFDNVEVGGRPPFEAHQDVPKVLIRTMRTAWDQNPSKRPSFVQIVRLLKQSITE